MIALIALLAPPLQAEDLTLAMAVDLGFRSNSSLRLQQNEMKKAELDGEIADSFSYPELSLFSSYAYSDPRMGVRKEIIPGMPPLEFNIGRNDMLSHGAQLRYVLYEGGRRSHMKEASLQMKEAARWLLLDRRRTVEYEVRRTFLGVLLLREIEHLATENRERHRRRTEDAQKAFQAGVIPRLEYLRAQAEEEDAKIAVDEATDRLHIGSRQLFLLLNIDPAVSPEPVGSLLQAAEHVQRIDVAGLRSKEPEFARLMAASFQRRAAVEAAEAKKADGLPTIVTGMKLAETTPYRGEKKYGPEVNAFVQLTYPLYDSGRSGANLERAKLDAENAGLQTDELERTLRSHYLLLLDRIESGQRTLRSRRTGIERARLALEAAQVAFKNGTIDLSRLLDTEILLLKSEVDYLRSTAEFYDNLADWERWSGQSSGQFLIFETAGVKNEPIP